MACLWGQIENLSQLKLNMLKLDGCYYGQLKQFEIILNLIATLSGSLPILIIPAARKLMKFKPHAHSYATFFTELNEEWPHMTSFDFLNVDAATYLLIVDAKNHTLTSFLIRRGKCFAFYFELEFIEQLVETSNSSVNLMETMF